MRIIFTNRSQSHNNNVAIKNETHDGIYSFDVISLWAINPQTQQTQVIFQVESKLKRETNQSSKDMERNEKKSYFSQKVTFRHISKCVTCSDVSLV